MLDYQDLIRPFYSIVTFTLALNLGVVHAHAQSTEWVEAFSIGKMDSDDEMDLYGDIDGIFVLSADSIYIADEMPMHIRRVNSSGTVGQIYGGRGAAPDQFLSMSAFTVSADGGLTVMDSRARRVKVFSADGELDATYSLDNVGFPRGLRQLDSGDYIAITARSGRPVDESRPLFVHTDDEFRVISKFGMTGEMQIDTTGFVVNYMDFNPGYFDVHGSRLVYVPPIHEGKLYFFDFDGERWSTAGIMETDVSSESLIEFDPSNRPIDAILIKSMIQPDYAAKILSRSIGIHFTSPTTVALFYMVGSEELSDEIEIRMEEYSVSGELISSSRMSERGNGRLSSVQSAFEIGAYSEGLFYVIDALMYPRVKAIRPTR